MTGFEPPAYPYDRLDGARRKAEAVPGGVVDLSVGTPCDPPPDAVIEALARSGAERGYPPSLGTVALREAATGWMKRRFGVEVPADGVAACVGTKEFVATLPSWMHLRRPDRSVVLYPGVAYPTYEMGAVLAGCRAVPVPLDPEGRMDLPGLPEALAEQALLLWLNSPGNPTGVVEDLAAVARWARERGIPVFSDECYVEFTWRGRLRTILQEGLDGFVAVHSLSKRSNMAGLRAGFYAGDPEVVGYLGEVRKHAGLMVPGPVQRAAATALSDDDHVGAQRARYRERLERFSDVLSLAGLPGPMPEGGFYLWRPAPDVPGHPTGGTPSERAWAAVESLASEGGVLVSPGEFFGSRAAGHVRVAMVQPTERLELAARRLSDAQ